MALIETAASFGFNAGVSVSFPGYRTTSTEGWNLGSSLSRREVEQIWAGRGTEITFALHALSGRLSRSTMPLTDREIAVMRLLIAGKRTKKIAADLGIAPVTVEFHLRIARQKLGAATPDAAVARFIAVQQGGPVV